MRVFNGGTMNLDSFELDERALAEVERGSTGENHNVALEPKLAQIAGIQNLLSLSHQSVLIDGVMYRPSISTADWAKVNRELVGEL